jgi:hypothetical protein
MATVDKQDAQQIAELINTIHVAADMLAHGKYSFELWRDDMAQAYIKLGDMYGIKCVPYEHYKTNS